MRARVRVDLQEDLERHATHPRELELELLLSALCPGNAYFSANQTSQIEGSNIVRSGPSSRLCDLAARRNTDVHRRISKGLNEWDYQIHSFRSHFQQLRGKWRPVNQFRPCR